VGTSAVADEPLEHLLGVGSDLLVRVQRAHHGGDADEEYPG
jgi:hypothetical protein